MKKYLGALLAGSSLLTLAPGALAQDNSEVPEDEIVVTGSQIRGVSPAGTAVIGIGEEEIQSSGATNGTELLAQLPQVSNYFNGMPGVGGNSAQFVNRSAVSRPNLRSLPNSTTANSPFTLALVDGHRMVPVGITNAAGFDPDTVSPSLVQRVEVLPDGASAIYGSDAVTGVVNYITRSSFDGVQVSGHYGTSAIGYESSDANVTVGSGWGSGNAYFSVSTSRHDAIFGRDVDYIAHLDYNPLSTTYRLPGLGCAPGNVTIGSAIYPLNGAGVIQPVAAATGGNRCDISDNLSVLPSQETQSIMIGFNQDFSDTVHFDLRAWIQARENVSNNGLFASPSPNVGGLSIAGTGANASPFYQAAPGTVGNPTQTLNIDFSPRLGAAGRVRTTDVDFWQITPRLTLDVGDWQVRGLVSLGETAAEGRSLDLNIGSAAAGTGINGAIRFGTFNPYTLTGSPTGLTSLTSVTYRSGNWDMTDYMVIADGPLFSLPAGELRAAIGAERNELGFEVVAPGLTGEDQQDVDSLFAEFQIPLVGGNFVLPFVNSLSLSASVRQDNYQSASTANVWRTTQTETIDNTLLLATRSFESEFETINTSFGLTWNPVGWVTVRANAGTSFTAPNAQDRVVVPQLTVTQNTVPDPLPFNPNGADPAGWPFTGPIATLPSMAPNAANAIALTLTSGSKTDLEPQTSRSWSAGFEIEPPFIEGLRFGASYYSINIRDMLASAATGGGLSTILGNFPSMINHNNGAPMTAAQIQALVTQSTGLNTGGAAQYASTFQACAEAAVPTCPVAYIADNRTQNLLELQVAGIDLNASYTQDTSFGSWDVTFNANTPRKYEQVSLGVFTDRLRFDNPEWKWALTGGITVNNLRAQATWQHTGTVPVSPGASGAPPAGIAPFGQTEVDAYDQVDLYFRYDLGAISFTDNAAISLNINNAFDAEPPFYAPNATFSYQGIFQGDSSFVLTPGRFIQVGIVANF